MMCAHQHSDNYITLRRQFLEKTRSCVNDNILNDIKDGYKFVINSARVFDQITTLEALLRILEKRGALDCQNVSPLRDIAQNYIQDSKLDEMITTFEKQFCRKVESDDAKIILYQTGKFEETISKNDYNTAQNEEPLLESNSEEVVVTKFYQRKRNYQHSWNIKSQINYKRVFILIFGVIFIVILCSFSIISFNRNNSNEKVLFNITDTEKSMKEDSVPMKAENSTVQIRGDNSSTDGLQNLVIINLSERLGRNWRDFARYLNVREADIDKIQKTHFNNTEESSKEILRIYFSKASPKNWKIPLLNALDKIRRKDLKELVTQLIYEDTL